MLLFRTGGGIAWLISLLQLDAGMTSTLERKLELFVRLSDADRLWLADALRDVRHVPARADLVAEGDDPRAVYVVLDGWAARCRNFRDGRRQITSLLLPGDCCDPHVFILGERDHTVTALTQIAVARVSGSAFLDLEGRSATLKRAFKFESLVESSIQRETAASLGRRTATERLAHLFCELHTRLAAIGLTDESGCPMPLTQDDLSDVLGQTSVHINRTLQDLRRRKLLSLNRRHLIIHDLVGLADLAHFDPAYLHALHPPREENP
jgi:CRP-like cAMP-binding protein